MLKNILLMTGVLLSLNALACWKVEGSFAVDGESWKINQKLNHNMEYALPMGQFILKLTVKQDNKVEVLNYVIHERKGIKLDLVSQGSEEVREGETQTIFAKGEEGRPQSIITIKLINI